jgi:hypothetical protein
LLSRAINRSRGASRSDLNGIGMAGSSARHV